MFLQHMLNEKLPIFLINTLLLHIPLLALTDGRNYGQRNEYTRCMWAGGTFFPVVLLCQFFVLVGNRFWFYILTYVTEQIILRTNIFLIVVEVLAMFFGGFLRRSNYDQKKRYSRLAVGWNKSQITVCRVKIRTPPITLSFKKILIGFLYFTESMRSKLSVTVYLFLALYGSTTLQSRSFLKNIENFLCKWKLVNNRRIPSMHEKLPIFLINTVLLHIPLLALTDGRNYGERNEYTCCAWAGGTFCPVVLLCQFLVLAGNRFWFYILTYVT